MDEAESGRVADRPEFRKMIDEGSRPNSPFEVILVWKFSRFTRKREHAVAFKSMLVWGVDAKDGAPPVRVEKAFPAIVTKQEFRRITRSLRSKAPARVNPRRASSPYLLSGLVKCEKCGKALTNGLRHPGDRDGTPIGEWISCRCAGVAYSPLRSELGQATPFVGRA